MDSFLFNLKKTLGTLLLPSSLIFLCLFFGFLIWPLRRRRRMARNCFFSALFIYIIAATAPIPNILLWWLEKPFKPISVSVLEKQHIDTLVILMGGISTSDSIYPIDQLNSYSRLRILKAWKIIQNDPEITRVIIIGGNKKYFKISEADIGKKFLEELKLPKRISIKVLYAYDTFQSLAELPPVVKGKKIGLITSAFHLRRAMYIARIFHINSVAIPCNYLHRTCTWSIKHLWPDPMCLEKSNIVTHEYLGLVWIWLCHFLYKY